ncbi:hypothetical protein MJO28_014970 [Puccinia striiformis f. sp. tritici]|uniref:Uncharacterized protein n=1 Tax=Puccinia striiformis f. sp. tritici TaxID=168172 RepID=A0ACC0DRM0_9BASI|nr:hypothetical protein MJO28_014970 [Puccinia striiformis f. sp. tritici]
MRIRLHALKPGQNLTLQLWDASYLGRFRVSGNEMGTRSQTGGGIHSSFGHRGPGKVEQWVPYSLDFRAESPEAQSRSDEN